MGVVADTSVFTVCERRRWNALQVAAHLAHLLPNEQVFISSIAAAELLHGVYRSTSEPLFAHRNAYIGALLSAYTVVPFTEDSARIAGKLRGEQVKAGNTLPLGDSLIAATALELGCALLTHNVGDFARIPGLRVIPFAFP